MVNSPSRAKITTIAPSSSQISLAPRLWLRLRRQAVPPCSVPRMLRHRLSHHVATDRYFRLFLGWQEFLGGEDGQILHRQAEQGKTGGDDAAGHRHFRPARNVVQPGG